MKKKSKLFLTDETGVTAIEYALIAGLVVTTLAFSLPLLAAGVASLYDTVVGGF
jgi:Flp pilus assembly pilin Flp